MRHAGGCRVLEKVARGRGEELHDRRVLERRGVRDVDDDRRALEGFSQALAGEGVDARVRRCRHGLMAVFPQSGHELRSDEPGAADDDEFHDRCSFLCVEPVHLTGVRIGAPLSFTRNTTNFAGAVWLAFRLTMCTSSGPS